ncbi:acyl-CoA dehydrogenase family protein [Nocardia sp. CA-128927]|uniref:acyl-CoA dehydrogenase family protein n=1 Tax=Nocardia sp. CA-128927 TaxID=3239975 RepID=UPI003D9805FA
MTLLSDAQTLDGAAILQNVRAVAPILRAEATESDRNRTLTQRTIETLRSTGVFRMPMPREWGGPEVDICTQNRIIEELSAADGAAGWCAMIGSDGGFYSAALEDEPARRLFSNLDTITAGWIVPAGRLHKMAGGFTLEGRWQFGSGCGHADVIIGGAVVFDNGAPVLTEVGRPEIRIALLPAEDFEILDTWHTTGLAGSGSHDYRISDAFVPLDQTFRFRDLRQRRREGPLYAWPGMFFANVPGVPLGIARASLEVAEQILADKMLVPEMRPAREDPRIRAGVAQAHAMVGSARSYLYDVLDELWTTLESGDEPPIRLRAALAGTYVHTIRACLDAVRILADVLGSVTIYRSCPIEGYLRDLTTISQHLMGQPKMLEMAGALWLGAEKITARHPLSAEGLI